jgi:DNA-binding transcriptional regulator/RsmH inhibitor MraZ
MFPKAWRTDSDTAVTKFYAVAAAPNVIKIFDQERFNKYYDHLLSLDEDDPEVLQALTLAGNLTMTVTPDRQGRFILSKELIEHGQLGANIVLVGCITFGRIVSKEEWESCKGNPLLLNKLNKTAPKPSQPTE